MVQSPSWEANLFAASQEIPRISRNPKVHYRTHKRPPPVSILGQPNPVHILTSHLLETHPNIIHPSRPRSPQWSLSLRFPHQDPIHPLYSPIAIPTQIICPKSTASVFVKMWGPHVHMHTHTHTHTHINKPSLFLGMLCPNRKFSTRYGHAITYMFVLLPTQISVHVLIQGMQKSVHVMEDNGRISIKLTLPFGPSRSYCAVWNHDVCLFWERATNCWSTLAEIEFRQADN